VHGRTFELEFNRVLASLGWQGIPIKGLFIKYDKDGNIDGILASYVDDFLISGLHTDVEVLIKQISDNLICTDAEPVNRFVGIDYTIDKELNVHCSQKAYVDSLTVGARTTTVPLLPIPLNTAKAFDFSPILDEKGTTEFRRILGCLMFVGNGTRPDIQVGCSIVSRWHDKPTQHALKLVQHLGKYTQATSHLGITIKPSPYGMSKLRLMCHCDASFGSHIIENPQLGYVVMHLGFILCYKSNRSRRTCKSTAKAELLALTEALEKSMYLRRGLTTTGTEDKLDKTNGFPLPDIFQKVDIAIGSDAQDVVSMLLSNHPKSTDISNHRINLQLQDKTAVMPFHDVLEHMSYDKVIVFKVPTHVNMADYMTKPLDVKQLIKHMVGGHPIKVPDGEVDYSDFYIKNSTKEPPAPERAVALKPSGPIVDIAPVTKDFAPAKAKLEN
jgi:hypothetical protein